VPSPASDAIASDVGHGTLGVRYGLRPFRDLLAETRGQRHLWVELRPRIIITGVWTLYSGSVYYIDCTHTFDGVSLPIVGVQTLTETLMQVPIGASIDAGYFTYDSGHLWVHLADDSNPADTTVIAEFGIHLGSHGVFQPVLGRDLLTNGTLDAWTGSSVDGWTFAGSGATLDQTAVDPLQGIYAARMTFASGAWGYLLQDLSINSLIAGNVFRLSGAYRVSGVGAIVEVFVYDTVTSSVLPDGRSLSSGANYSAFQELAGLGEWRRFTFDFVCPSWTTVRIYLQVSAAAAWTGTVDFDDLKLQWIPRYAYHDPRLLPGSFPTIEAARSDAFWGDLSGSLGALVLANGNSYWNTLVHDPIVHLVGSQLVVRVGGRFQLGADEVLLEDCPIIALARVGAMKVSDVEMTLDLEDDRTFLQRPIPKRTYNNTGGSIDAFQQPDRGRARALLWGTKEGIKPVQYDITYYNSSLVPTGVFEIVDCTDWPEGIMDIPYVYWYEDDNAAANRDSGRWVRQNGIGYAAISPDLANGRFTANYDLHPIFITHENNKLHFDTGGVPPYLVAILTPGVYPLAGTTAITSLDTLIQAAMRAVGAGDETCTLTLTTAKFQLSKASGTLNLRCATGATVQMGIWDVLGFDASVDRTAGKPYNGDSVVVTPVMQQIVRCDATGFSDDNAGTYTGVMGGQPIEKSPDVSHHLLRTVLGVAAAAIDVPSFALVRTTTAGAYPVSLYVGSQQPAASILRQLEIAGNFDVLYKGGIWYCRERLDAESYASASAGITAVADDDILELEWGFNPDDLYDITRVVYNESPDGGQPVLVSPRYPPPAGRTLTREFVSGRTKLVFNRPHDITFVTCIRDTADATSRANDLAWDTCTQRRRARLKVKGKVLLLAVGEYLTITYRGETVGTRILSKRDDWSQWVSELECIEVVTHQAPD